MNKSKFIKQVLKSCGELSSIGTFFYVSPVEHILSGFLADITPGGLYVTRFVFPLYDSGDHLHLLYSKRFEGKDGYIDTRSLDAADVASRFVTIISDHLDEAKQMLSIQRFAAYCEERDVLMTHERAQMGYGLTQLLLGDKENAVRYLAKAEPVIQEPYRTRCSEIMQIASSSLDSAMSQVLAWESRLKLDLNL